MDHFFKFAERGTNLRTEIVAGLTTFMTMAYIIFVNPTILGTEGTGLSVEGVFVATCLAAAAASIAMGVVANFPVALASGLGLNAVVTFTLILGLGIPWQTAMAAVIVEGLLVTLLVLTNLREAVLNAIPLSLKFAIAVGIGLFIAFIVLRTARSLRLLHERLPLPYPARSELFRSGPGTRRRRYCCRAGTRKATAKRAAAM